MQCQLAKTSQYSRTPYPGTEDAGSTGGPCYQPDGTVSGDGDGDGDSDGEGEGEGERLDDDGDDAIHSS
ncbi:hypothetical protein GB937_000873 [Aspergillus fischeri]|nr:hypothetical protein GB937_000873 [Aspergillus fischeri]